MKRGKKTFQKFNLDQNKDLNLPNSRAIAILNPYTEETFTHVQDSSEKELDSAVQKSKAAFETWKNTTPAERSNLFIKLAEIIEKNKDSLAILETQNTGKPITLSKEDINSAIDNIKFFASAARTLQSQSSDEYDSSSTSIVKREPLGIIAAITPWNYPFLIACWKLAAVAAGNCIILKPSSYTPLTTLELEKLAIEAGFPKNVIQVLTGTGDRLGTFISIHPEINGISFTGSTQAGKELSKLASENVKKLSLELGGKAPFIVFEDADLEKASDMAVKSSLLNSGQDCTATTRIYVQEKIYDHFIKMVKKKASEMNIGDPMKSQTNFGPLISEKQREKFNVFMKSLEPEEKIIYQSEIPKKGFFVPITIIKDMKQKSNLGQNEAFSPIIALAKFKTEQEAIDKANDCQYGLSSSIWTQNIKKALKVSKALNFGEVSINDAQPVISEMPHSGRKMSGTGVDLSQKALEEFTAFKHIYINTE